MVHWIPFSTQEGRGASFCDTSYDVWLAASLAILKCGSFAHVADKEYVVPSGRLTLSTRWIAPNPKDTWWRNLWSHLRALECASWRIRAAPVGNSQRESLEKQSRVSCQKRIGIHIPTGCGNVIQLPKEVIRHRSGGPQINQWHQMREVWPGPKTKTRGQLGRCHGARVCLPGPSWH